MEEKEETTRVMETQDVEAREDLVELGEIMEEMAVKAAKEAMEVTKKEPVMPAMVDMEDMVVTLGNTEVNITSRFVTYFQAGLLKHRKHLT